MNASREEEDSSSSEDVSLKNLSQHIARLEASDMVEDDSLEEAYSPRADLRKSHSPISNLIEDLIADSESSEEVEVVAR